MLIHTKSIGTQEIFMLTDPTSFSHFGAKLWNEIPWHIQHLPKNKFKKTLCKLLFDILNSEDDCIDMPTLIKKVQWAKHVEKQILATGN